MSDMLSRSEVMKAVHDACQPDDDDGAVIAATRRDTLRRVQETLERLSGRARVKPLEWREERFGQSSAETIVGRYEVGFDDGWWAQLEDGVVWDWEPNQDPRSYLGPETAKAAAQADYEARILAALEPAPTPPAREKALREAARACQEVRLRHLTGKTPEKVCFEYENAILALIPTGGSHDHNA